MNWHDYGEILFELVKWITSIGVVVKTLQAWGINPLMKQFNQAVGRQIEPLNNLVHELKIQNEQHRQEYNQIKELSIKNSQLLEKHESRLDQHNERIIILETQSKMGNQVTQYKEEYR